MVRKAKNASGQVKLHSKFKSACIKYREDRHLSMTEFAEQLGGYKQSRLSQFETREEGPPLDLVKKYADFFGLTGFERTEFFQAALESSKIITLDVTTIRIPSFWKQYFIPQVANILAGCYSDSSTPLPPSSV
jgi:transcriptional regulator with XRE-family HTH domain